MCAWALWAWRVWMMIATPHARRRARSSMHARVVVDTLGELADGVERVVWGLRGEMPRCGDGAKGMSVCLAVLTPVHSRKLVLWE